MSEGNIRAYIRAHKPAPIIAGNPADVRPLCAENKLEKAPTAVPSTEVPRHAPKDENIPHPAITLPVTCGSPLDQFTGELLVHRALTTVRRFLNTKVQFYQPLQLQLLQFGRDRIRGAEALARFPLPHVSMQTLTP